MSQANPRPENVVPSVPVAATIAELVPLEKVRTQLALVWFGGAGAFLVLLIVQSLGTVFTGKVPDLFAWALPTIMPTLGLIGSVLAAQAVVRAGTEMKDAWVRASFFRLTRLLSIAYLVVLLVGTPAITVVASTRTGANALEMLALSNYWLAPLQTLVALVMGALFFSKEQKE